MQFINYDLGFSSILGLDSGKGANKIDQDYLRIWKSNAKIFYDNSNPYFSNH